MFYPALMDTRTPQGMSEEWVIRRGWRCALLLIIFLQFGCTKVGPNYVRPETNVRSNWLESEDHRVKSTPADDRGWWHVFNDPVLDRLIDTAYRQNLTIRIAAVRVLEARAQLGIAVGRLYPQTQQASGSLAYNRLSQNSQFGSLTSGTGSTYTQDQIGLNATWEIDFWGKFRRAIESADANLQASVADYDSALVSLTADVADLYILLRTLESRLEIARQNMESQRETLAITEARWRAGASSERDVEQARTVLFSTEATIPALQTQLQQNRHALSVLLGLPPSDLSAFLDGTSAIPVAPIEIAVGIPADLLRRRPDVRSAEFQAVSQGAQIGVARADLLPSFSLTGSFGLLSTNIGRSGLGDIFNWGSRAYTAGPGFQWNLFNYGRIVNNVRLQDSRFQELLINYQNIVLRAQQDVEDALSGFLRSREQAESHARSAEAARRSLELAGTQYRGGVVDFTTVLTGQQALLSQQDSLASTLGEISRNVVRTYRALGGGWEIREGKDLIPPEVREVMAGRTDWGDLLSPATYMPIPEERKDIIRQPDW